MFFFIETITKFDSNSLKFINNPCYVSDNYYAFFLNETKYSNGF